METAVCALQSSLLQAFVHFSKVDKATEIYYTAGNFFPKSTKPFRCAERGTVQWDFRLPGAQFKEI